MLLREAENFVDRGTDESYEQAITFASIGLAMDAKLIDLRFTRAYALDKLKQYSSAIPDWKACVEGGHRAAGSAMKLGSSYYETGKFKEAVGLYDRILDGDLNNAYQREGINRYSLLMLRGMALAESGDFDKALDDLMEVKRFSAAGGQTDYWILVCRYRGDKKLALAEVGRM
jgi:tetratricopeptide (TPR) repeat protein